MSFSCSRKVPDGKMVSIDFDKTEKGELSDVSITGDFFVEPPEAIEEFNNRLEGLDLDSDNILQVLEVVDAELIGFSREDIVKCIENAEGEQ